MSKTIYNHAASLAFGIFFAASAVHGGETPAKFLGANSCASSSCHGGGGQNQNQFLVWSLKDFHSQRPTATLTTARSKQIADALQIKDPSADSRCTTCHAPLHEVPENLRGENFKVSEGVSCESCHGAAENWLRAHTRKDYTRADRTAAGMRDLQNLYVRANTCVACHQNVDADILKAGHPELIFELDGQSVAEPKHWQEATNWNGAQAWFIGQAVALREMSWQIAKEHSVAETNLLERIQALSWLLNKTAGNQVLPMTIDNEFEKQQQLANQMAQETSKENWQPVDTHIGLKRLISLASDFADEKISRPIQARRAERLVLALDRLVAALPELKNNEPVQSSLNQLFKLAQSIPDFDPKEFAAALEKFSTALAAR